MAGNAIALPAPATDGRFSVEAALAQRASVRHFKDAPASLTEAGQLLWAAQGITRPAGLRTVPSAGALYPLEVYLIGARVAGLAPGVYRYRPREHALEPHVAGNVYPRIAVAALHQEWLQEAPLMIAIAAVPARTQAKYRDRALQYVHMEVGHAAQNVLLQATALGLSGTPVGAFQDEALARLLNLPAAERIFILLPVGRAATAQR